MSITRTNQIRCDSCGKFIPINDLMHGLATHTMVLPDSEYSAETFESECSYCKPPRLPQEGEVPHE
jgi:hypothetical protein